jgi:hypothetical protein
VYEVEITYVTVVEKSGEGMLQRKKVWLLDSIERDENTKSYSSPHSLLIHIPQSCYNHTQILLDPNSP